MGVPRARPSHRYRRWASGPTRPTKAEPQPQRLLPSSRPDQPLSDLARYFAAFDPDKDVDVQQPTSPIDLRLRSVPWDDILDDDLSCLACVPKMKVAYQITSLSMSLCVCVCPN
jgi:hypothetical protein